MKRKQNQAWIDYNNKLEEKRQERLNEKFKDSPPAKMGRSERRKYISHYTKLGVPREEVERIIMMRQFDFKENSGVNMAEIAKKIQDGSLPSNTFDIINSYNQTSE